MGQTTDDNKGNLSCSFCGKCQKEVKKLIAVSRSHYLKATEATLALYNGLESTSIANLAGEEGRLEKLKSIFTKWNSRLVDFDEAVKKPI